MKRLLQYTDGNCLSYAEYGDKNGYPILIQHGLIASITDFHLFDRLIDAGFRLISIARAGYGESSPYVMNNIAEWGKIVAVLAEELKLSQFDILGISSGAPYSYAVGYQIPEKVRNIFVLSGIPALCEESVRSYWPYPTTQNASIPEMETLAYELFFSKLSEEDLKKDDIKDSMRNNCFGIAQDLKLRCIDWGFQLSGVKANVCMQHSRTDQNVPLITVEMTADLLPNCQLKISEHGEHFSKELLDDFIKITMLEHYELKSKSLAA